jgi:hypothetical protein
LKSIRLAEKAAWNAPDPAGGEAALGPIAGLIVGIWWWIVGAPEGDKADENPSKD